MKRRRFIAMLPFGMNVIPRVAGPEDQTYADMELHARITLKGAVKDKRHLPIWLGKEESETMDILRIICSITGPYDAAEHLIYKLTHEDLLTPSI